MRRKHKKIIIGLILLVILAALIFPRLGQWLLAQDEPVQSDIIVVLMGSVPNRILEAVDLYQEGYSDKILMADSYVDGYENLLDRGIVIPNDAENSKFAAISLGVTQEDITIIPGNTRNTQDEALMVREYLKDEKDIDSILLVTSKYHSRRAKNIFTKVLHGLDREVRITSTPSRYDTFNAKEWWKDREDASKLVGEYLKLLNFYLIEQFQI